MVFRRTTKMNVGFYVDSVGATPENGEIFDALNQAVDNHEVSDASVFYNDIDYNPVKPKFGLFNATDLWSFTGLLIATSLENVIRASKVVNKFKMLYLYNKGNKNLLMLLDICQSVPIVTTSPEDSKEIYRLTGKKPITVPKLSVNELLKVA